jgi:predicted RNase H-like HicB family nuclease
MTSPLYRRQGVAFRAVFRPDIGPGTFAVTFPDLPGCVGRGAGFVQARDHAKHVLDAWIDGLVDRGEVIPTPASDQAQPDARAVWIFARSDFERRRVPSARRTL